MNRVWCLLRKAIPILVITTMLSSIITVAPVFAAATPTVTSISPNSGTTAGGTSVTINGTDLSSATAVNFGSNTAAITSDTATQIVATSPAGTAGTIDITVTTAGGPSPTSTADQFTYVTGPTVTSISPNSGTTAGGTSVTINGTDLSSATAVNFGGNTAAITSDTTTQIVATSPAGAAGTIDITVTTAGGTSPTSAADQFTYVTGPTVTSISPNSGTTAGGTSVTINGTDLSSATAVKFGSNTAAITSDTTTQIVATSPAGAAGTIDITVTTAGGASATSSADHFTYAPIPAVIGVSVNSGPATGGTVVTVTGSGFYGGGASSAVSAVDFGATAGTSLSVTSDTTLNITSPAGSGTVDITVVTPGGISAATSNDHFTYAEVTVTGISPSYGPLAEGTPVTITGIGFVNGATVTIGSALATGVTFVNSTSITAVTPSGTAGSKNIQVTNPDLQAGTLENGFTFEAVTVTSISPPSGPTAGGTSVTITGTGFASGATVTIGGNAATGVTYVSATSIKATTPAGTVGSANVVVTVSPNSSPPLSGGFTYEVTPTVTGVTPSSGPTAGGTKITITGTGFVTGATVTIGGIAATVVTVVNTTSITATTPAGTAGAQSVIVTTPGGPGTLTDGFTYEVTPTVTNISPNSGPVAGGTAVTITGTGFASGATVTIGGNAATGVTVVSSTSITATTPAGTAGTQSVVVTTTGGPGTLTNGFTYVAAPTVASISPNSGPLTGGTSVTITGTAFVSGATVKVGGTSATSVTFVSATSIKAVTPTGTAGAQSVVVTNPDSQSSNTNITFTYATVTVASISPSSGPLAGGTAVTITGTGFASGASVNIGSAAATSVTFVNATSITAITAAGTAGGQNVVVTVSGVSSPPLTGGFTYESAPTVISISPSFGPLAGGTKVTITGTGFLGGATVTIGGTAATGITVVSASSITATTPAGAVGARNVVVTNPDNQFGTLTGGFAYSNTWWNTSYSYCKLLTITNETTSPLSSYDVEMMVPYTSHMEANFGDIRFVADDNNTALSYWLNNDTTTSSTGDFWVLIPSLPASGTVNIYMYYGDSSATSTSNINATFPLGADDFENTAETVATGASGNIDKYIYADDVGGPTTENIVAAATATNPNNHVLEESADNSSTTKKDETLFELGQSGTLTAMPLSYVVQVDTKAISIPGGSGATATATVTGGVVTSITVTNGGTGYAEGASVTITASSGVTPTAVATAMANISNGVITSITIPTGDGGSGYTSGASVNIYPSAEGAYICNRYSNVSNKYEQVLDFTNNYADLNVVVGDAWSNLNSNPLGFTTAASTWYTLSAPIQRDATVTNQDDLQVLVNGTLEISGHDVALTSNTGLAFLAYNDSGAYNVEFDNLRIMPYAYILPSTSFGSEQTQVVQTTTPPSSGGGGGGGVPISGPSTVAGVTNFPTAVNAQGVLSQDVDAWSNDNNVLVYIPAGTTVLSSTGAALSQISITQMATPPAVPTGAGIIGLAYDFEPSGTTFNPAATIRFSYNPASLPAGVSPSSLQIAYYSTATSSWVTLTTTEVDATNHFIYAQISHFTSYALTYGNVALAQTTTTTTTTSVITTPIVTTTTTHVVTTTTTTTPVVTTTTPIGTTTTTPVTTTTTTPVVTPLPATFETSALSISPSEINTGDTDTIQATVTNSGDVSGTYTAVLKIDGNIESTQDLALTAGEAQNVVFSVSENTAGTY